jgi:hypothetical protein
MGIFQEPNMCQNPKYILAVYMVPELLHKPQKLKKKLLNGSLRNINGYSSRIEK